MANRYETDHLIEAQFEPGSGKRVLKNLQGIKRKREMDALEAIWLSSATDWAIHYYSEDHRFTAQDIGLLHRQWLGNIYEWAGEYRRVNISKGGFMFAMATQVPRLMDELDRKILATYTPNRFTHPDKVAEAMAITHCELILIHPFREGNGRISRLLATLMALQAGLPLLDFSDIKGQTRQAYYMAVQASMTNDYAPMKRIFQAVSNAASGFDRLRWGRQRFLGNLAYTFNRHG